MCKSHGILRFHRPGRHYDGFGDSKWWAHFCSEKEFNGTAGLVHGLNVEYFAFDRENWNIDVDKTKEKIKKLEVEGKKPKMAMFGGSLFLFSTPGSRGCRFSEPGVVGSNCVFHLPTPGGSRDLRRTVLYPTGDDKARAPFDIALEQYRAVPCQYQQSYRLLSVHVNSCADLHVLWGGLQPESAL